MTNSVPSPEDLARVKELTDKSSTCATVGLVLFIFGLVTSIAGLLLIVTTNTYWILLDVSPSSPNTLLLWIGVAMILISIPILGLGWDYRRRVRGYKR